MSTNKSNTLVQVEDLSEHPISCASASPETVQTDASKTEQKKKSIGHSKRVKHLMTLATARGELFRQTGNANEAETFITINDDGKQVTLPIESTGFDQWLINSYRKIAKGAIAGETARRTAITALTAIARHECPAYPTFTRTGSIRDEDKNPTALYYDLANESGQVVEITADGWKILDGSPVKFVRRTNCTQQVTPTHDGADINLLRPFINIEDEDEWKLFIGVVLSWFEHRDFGGYFGLLLNGTQDAAKTTTARMIKRIVDPSPKAAETPDLPDKTDDLWLMASQMWLLSFDNLSDITKRQADHLCRISTGGGSMRRTLYANNEITTYDARRPIVMNGISELATRGDLANRCVQVTLPSLKNSERKAERELWSEFDAVLPRILGGFFNALSCALRNRATISISNLPRMSDGALLVTAAESSLQWESGTFVRLYNQYRDDEDTASIEGDPFAIAVAKRIQTQLSETSDQWFTTTAEKLMEDLRNEAGSNYFPQTGRTTGDALRRIAPALNASGLEVIPPGRKQTRINGQKGRWWRFRFRNDPDFPPEIGVEI
jgi:hypothetical protein